MVFLGLAVERSGLELFLAPAPSVIYQSTNYPVMPNSPMAYSVFARLQIFFGVGQHIAITLPLAASPHQRQSYFNDISAIYSLDRVCTLD